MGILRGAGSRLAGIWPIATVAGTMVGRLIQFGIDMGAAHALPGEWSAPLEYAGGFVVGALTGAAMALPQASAMYGRVPGGGRWIAVRALAWACALPLLLLLFRIEGAFPAATSGIAAVVATFAVVAAGVGALEVVVMEHLLRAGSATA